MHDQQLEQTVCFLSMVWETQAGEIGRLNRRDDISDLLEQQALVQKGVKQAPAGSINTDIGLGPPVQNCKDKPKH
ncbi:hypothetical protein M8J77_014530 [Diaphorina citri]|nr:hypothetical protein M8J77_014530 [Diaphorina citri]